MIEIQKTYEIIVTEAFFFYDLRDYLKNSDNEIQNAIPANKYEQLLEDYIERLHKKKDIKTISETLKLDNLKEHNIIHSRGYNNNIHYISIAKHVNEMISNIYKKFDKSLNQTHYNDYVERFHSKKIYFKENSFRKTQELEDTVVAFEDLLEDIAETLRNTVSSLSFFQRELSKLPTDTDDSSIESKLKKMKEVKKIRTKYIEPLNHFLHKKYPFVSEIHDLMSYLNKLDNKTARSLHDKINFYYTVYIYIVEEAKEIRKYFVNYIKQNEQELYWNLGSEHIFNQLIDISNLIKDGRKINTKIWSEDTKLKELDVFFQNISLKEKEPETIKEVKFEEEEFKRYSAFVIEVLENEKNLKQIKYIQLKEAERENLLKIEIEKRNIFLEKVLSSYLLYMEDFDLSNIEIVETSLLFLKQNYEWDIALLEYLVFQLISAHKNRLINFIEEKTLIKKDIKVTYWEINFKEIL